MIYRKGYFPLLFVALLSACAVPSTPPTFYVLPTRAHERQDLRSLTEITWIGLGPLALPSYLDRPELVLRSADDRLEVSDFDLWAGPLEREILRVLEINLAGLLGPHRVAGYPWRPGLPVDWQLELDILELDHFTDGRTRLRADWALFAMTDPIPARSGTVALEVPGGSGGTGFSAVAAGYAAVLWELSRKLAAELKMVGVTSWMQTMPRPSRHGSAGASRAPSCAAGDWRKTMEKRCNWGNTAAGFPRRLQCASRPMNGAGSSGCCVIVSDRLSPPRGSRSWIGSA